MAFEYRLAAWHYDRMPGLVADLVRLKVDVIVAANGTPWTLAAKTATTTIPIVFVGASDPVGSGIVANLARPGGNLTGFGVMTAEQMPKSFGVAVRIGSTRQADRSDGEHE